MERIVDEKGSTLLHVTANNNNAQMMEYYLREYTRLIKSDPKRYSTQNLVRWIAMKDSEGFCCLHYAVFTQNYEMTLLLERNGATI